MFSEKVKSINESPIRKFAPYSNKAQAEGKTVIPMNIGQPDIATPKEYFEAIKSVDDSTIIAYTSSNGLDVMTEAFSRYYKRNGIEFDKQDILVTNGGSEALSFLFTCLCDEGDEVLVFEPYYANYNTIAKCSDARLVPVTTREEDDFRLPSKEEIASKINERTKAVLVTNPNNPTGVVLSREEIETIVELALEYDLFILSDEVYREFIYDDKKYISFTEYPEINDRLAVIDSVSKRFSGCGMRIGCIASKNKTLMEHALKLCQARLCVPYLEQIGAAAVFDVDDSYIENAKSEYKKRRDICIEYASKIQGARFKCPDGAFYFILGLPVDDAEKFAAWMLSEFSVDNETVMLCPASDFYITQGKGKDEIRISYCISCERLARAMDILARGVKAYNKKNCVAVDNTPFKKAENY